MVIFRLACALVLCLFQFHCTTSRSGKERRSVNRQISWHGKVPTSPYDNAPAEVLYNLKVINQYRAKAGVKPLVLDKVMSKFSEDASRELASSRVAHGKFTRTISEENGLSNYGFCGGGAENQAPGWPSGDTNKTIDRAMKAMMDEGPGGGHHDNMLAADWGKVGIGIVVDKGAVYITNDLSPVCD